MLYLERNDHGTKRSDTLFHCCITYPLNNLIWSPECAWFFFVVFFILVWAALPACVVQLAKGVQKSARRIIFPDCSYESALVNCGLPKLLARRDEACRCFISNIKESGFLAHLLPQPMNVTHGYGLRS